MTCPNCGENNLAGAKFCHACGRPLTQEQPEVRKVVTVLFCDVSGSTALGERLDPESVRHVMGGFFAEARTAIERHGGTVEKFIGDAVMAVFGIPATHEDDALRAVRAASDIRHALARLNLEFSREFGIELSIRTGVNTGVVVVGGESLVTGDAVNTAARLEQAAPPGEILLGAQTFKLIRSQVRAERIEPLELKGKTLPVEAFRLIEVITVHAEQPLHSGMIGRERELRAVMETFDDAALQRRSRLCTIVGHAGIGKSRLVAELVTSLEANGRVVRGRCLSYGKGITFWPIGEIVRTLAGIADNDTPEEAVAKVSRLVPDDDCQTVAERVGALVGIARTAVSEVEGCFAVRRLFESAARVSPLVVVIEDLHWAEPTLLDLVEYLALGIHSAPVQLVCTARPELMDQRPGWATSIPQALTVMLEPLDADESRTLLAKLLGGGTLAPDVSQRIAEAAGGNPLYLEETFAMLIDDGLIARDNGRWVVAGDLSSLRIPPTIHALLSARIDRLPAQERTVLERASVIGKVFYPSAVSDLLPDPARPQVGAELLSLLRKGFIVPTESDLPGEDAYCFRHVLIRDAAYQAISKATRAESHERLAHWLERRAHERADEVNEIVGYHLEHAFRLRSELGNSEAWQPVAEEASTFLAKAGRRALSRRDLPAATSLLERARSLLPGTSPLHGQLGLDLANALYEAGRFEQAGVLLRGVEKAAASGGNDVQLAHARVQLQAITLSLDPEGAAETGRAVADAVMPVFEAAQDDLGIAQAWQLRAEVDHMLARFAPYAELLERALVHLRRTGDRVSISRVLATMARSVTLGPIPVSEGLIRMGPILEEVPDDRLLRAKVRLNTGILLALQGRRQEAIDAEEEAEMIIRDMALDFHFGSFGLTACDIELALGRLDRAEKVLRRSDEVFEQAGERSLRSTVVAVLAWALIEQGRTDEAERLADLALELGSTDDFATVAHAYAVLGRVQAVRGDPSAEQTVRRAVAVADETDVLWLQGQSWNDLGIVLLAQGRANEARAAFEAAIDRYERKGATVFTDRVRGRLATMAPLAT